jgi:signal transduction histidine kinase
MSAHLRLGEYSCFIHRMHAKPGNAKSTPDQKQSLHPDDRPALRRLRAVLALGYGGLLVLLLGSGANALQTLRKLHDAEESARQRSVERRRVLTTVVLSATVYSNNVERILLSEKPPEDDGITAEVLQRAKEALSAVKAYPPDTSLEEQNLLAHLQASLLEEQDIFRSVQGWKPQEFRGRAQQVVSEELIPRRQQFVTIAQQIEMLNDNETLAAEQASFSEFGRLQERLTRLLLVALTSGLILAIGSAIYILRLERQERLRYAELAHNREELQELSARLVDAQETERRSLSRELHDEVGQALGLLLMDVGRLSNQLGGDAKGQEMVQRIKTVAERTVQTVRNMALLLRPSMLDDLGLVSALEWYAREVSRSSETEVEVKAESVSENLPDPLMVCIYRVVQEAVNNAQRHARAKNVTVELKETDTSVQAQIKDDGSGFDGKRTRGIGLLGMEERVKRLGGTISIESQPGTGTTIRAELPLHVAKSSHQA